MFRTHYNKDLKLWSGNNVRPCYNPKISIGEVVLHSLVANGPRIAQVRRSQLNLALQKKIIILIMRNRSVMIAARIALIRFTHFQTSIRWNAQVGNNNTNSQMYIKWRNEIRKTTKQHLRISLLKFRFLTLILIIHEFVFRYLLIFLHGIITGAKLIITTESFSPEHQLRLIEQYKVSLILDTPSHIASMLDCDRLNTVNLSSVRLHLYVGSKVNGNTIKRWNKITE